MEHLKTALTGLLLLTGMAGAMTLEAHHDEQDRIREHNKQVIDSRVQDDLREFDPSWNCLTMGDRQCSISWDLVPQELGDVLAEGVETDLNWEDDCRVRYADILTIVCADGGIHHLDNAH